MRTCVAHSRPLLGLAALKSPRNAHDFHGRIIDDFVMISSAVKASGRRPPTDLESYLVARLQGRVEYNWLNKFCIQVASKTCEMLGAVMMRGPTANLAAFQAEDWLAAGSAGVAVASQGEEAFRAALAQAPRQVDHRLIGGVSTNGWHSAESHSRTTKCWTSFEITSFLIIRSLQTKLFLERNALGDEFTPWHLLKERQDCIQSV